jgi:hypothetical protein
LYTVLEVIYGGGCREGVEKHRDGEE